MVGFMMALSQDPKIGGEPDIFFAHFMLFLCILGYTPPKYMAKHMVQ